MDLLRMSRLTRGHRCTISDHVPQAGAIDQEEVSKPINKRKQDFRGRLVFSW